MARGTSKKIKDNAISGADFLQLQLSNRWFAGINLLEAIAIFVFGAAYSVPIAINYLAVNPINSAVAGHSVLSTATRPLFNVSITGLIAIIFLVAALAHGLLATVYRKRYEAEISQGVNTVRWLEYAITAGLMLVLIAIVSGVYDLATLIAIFGFMIIMNLLGLITEVMSRNTPNWLTYWSGAVAGFVPWLIIGVYAFSATYYGNTHIPTYVYWIYGTMFLCTASFALTMYAHYKRQGRWARYLYVERAFMILSLVTKTLLAWQIFAGILRP